MSVTYTRINWEDSPSTQTPINAENLNAMDSAIDDLAGAVNDLDGVPGDIEELQADVAGLKNDFTQMSTATASDEGKALLAKTVSGGKVTEWEFGEAGGADPAVIEQAVTDWLDEHPEATTTVQDGSITEAKMNASFLPEIANNYVTPEMFGAVGDGTTDDTQAIKDMFASDNTNFYFGYKTYIIDGAIDVVKKCQLWFNNTTLMAKSSSAVRDFEYMLGFKAPDICTFGTLNLMANTSVNIGLFLSQCGRLKADNIAITNARIWGAYVDRASDGNNSLMFHKLSAAQCGYKVSAKATVIANNQLQITEMSCNKVNYANIHASLFGNEYNQCGYVIDDSLFTNDVLHNRYVIKGGGNTSPFVLDSEDTSKAIFTAAQSMASGYSAENERTIFIPVGGGINFQSAHSEGVFVIDKFVTMSNPISAIIGMGYGGCIGSYSSEFDTIVMINNAMSLTIDYMYAEAVGNGLSSLFNSGYDTIYVISENTNAKTFLNHSFRLPLKQGCNVVIGNQLAYNTVTNLNGMTFLFPAMMSAFKNSPINIGWPNATVNINIDENTASPIVIDANGGGNIVINLSDLYAYRMNIFAPVIIYFRKRVQNPSTYNDLTIRLSSNLTSAGYSINGSIDGVLTLHHSDYNNFTKITIILLKYTNTFFVSAEPIAFVDNTIVSGE